MKKECTDRTADVGVLLVQTELLLNLAFGRSTLRIEEISHRFMRCYLCGRRSFARALIFSLGSIFAVNASAQSRQPLITTSLGFIRNLERLPNRPHYSIYPEVQLNALLVDLKPSLFEIGGSLYVGGFWERNQPLSNHRCGPREPDSKGCFDAFHSSLILGARINAVLRKAPAYVSGFVGLSRHYAWTNSNSFYYQNSVLERVTSLEAFQAIEVGLRIQVPINSRILVGTGVQIYTRLAEPKYHVSRRAAYTVGVSYRRK